MVHRDLNNRILALTEKIKDLLAEYYGDRMVSLCFFGSGARGQLREGSDLDFLVVTNDEARSYHKRAKELIPVLERIRETIQYEEIEEFRMALEPCFLILTVEEIKNHPPILLDLSQEGVILLDQEGFLEGHLKQIREKLMALGAIRRPTAQGHYWVLKPDFRMGEIIEI